VVLLFEIGPATLRGLQNETARAVQPKARTLSVRGFTANSKNQMAQGFCRRKRM
jgi:hypothetical protein